jgi:acyl carrier protein
LANGARQAAVLPMQWDLFLAPDREHPPTPLYDEIPRSARPAKPVEEKAPLLRELQNEALAEKRLQRLTAFVRDRVVQVLGLPSADGVETGQPIREMGLDSLMAVEIRNALGVPFGEPLPVSLLYDYPTVDALAGYLMQRFGGAATTAEPETAVTAARTEVAQASEAEAEALLLKELEALNF